MKKTIKLVSMEITMSSLTFSHEFIREAQLRDKRFLTVSHEQQLI
ncbi:MAG: hypothetical protein US96_C0029G0004 [Candidatus Woesebacteria bacterium GW2011_GWB1_38_5b]|uniref:Uncharacterized protein n=1 Tax=Candidatus Woesebacteria bacterium GW2011_GWB1_38_5b TaxID=1618569 RepID=A0A0G0KGJ9_9BACT|nr:MAG: hypothetical protein US96_C0029G0004 [Candidatus Woesebacteria bacterium GW2011_GWB1_38_5b]